MKLIIFFFTLTFACAAAQAQDGRQAAYMIPPKVYVGDRASLVVPLQGFSANGNSANGNVEIPPARIPRSPDIDIYRVAIDRRPGGSRLTVEFSAFAPGILELPPLEIAGEVFSGLAVEISSILEPGETNALLSGPARPLAIPGTSLLVYGTLASAVVSLLLALWALLWGRRQVKDWAAAWKRRRLLVSMLGIEKRLRKALAKGNAPIELLDTLTGEFRAFLACYSGVNFRSMTAMEIGRLETAGGLTVIAGGGALGGFFGRCDEMRYSSREIDGGEALAVFDETKSLLVKIQRAGRGKAP